MRRGGGAQGLYAQGPYAQERVRERGRKAHAREGERGGARPTREKEQEGAQGPRERERVGSEPTVPHQKGQCDREKAVKERAPPECSGIG